MSTYTALHIQKGHREHVISRIAAFFFKETRYDMEQEYGPWSPDIYERRFSVKEELPTFFAAADTPPGWCTVHFNACYPVEQLADFLSIEFQQRVIVLLIRSVSDAYYVGVHEFGHKRRALSFSNGEWWIREGKPYPFETESSDTDDDSENSKYLFCAIAQDEVSEYCRRLGLKCWDPDMEFPEQWLFLRKKN